MSCPKCSHKNREGAESCARCGLVFANWSPEKAADVVKLDEEREAMWTALEADWDDDKKHDEFLKACSMAGLLAAAGRRYRERLDRSPGDPVVARMQERILAMATAVMTHRPAPPTPVTRTKLFWAVVGLCAVAGALGAIVLAR